MKKIALIFYLFAFNSLAIENQLSICTRDNELRAIEIFYLTQDRVPCEVNYTKNRINKILWKAWSSEGFCEAKADELINKHKDWGWNCRSVLSEPVQ